MPKNEEQSDLEKAFREMKPGGRHDIKNSEGRVVATLGMPARQPDQFQGVEGSRTLIVGKKSAWLD